MTSPERPLPARDLVTLWPEIEGRLSQRQAEMLSLYIDGNSHEEIALAMGVSTKTVEGNLHAIRKALGFPDRRSLGTLLLRSLVQRLSRQPDAPQAPPH